MYVFTVARTHKPYPRCPRANARQHSRSLSTHKSCMHVETRRHNIYSARIRHYTTKCITKVLETYCDEVVGQSVAWKILDILMLLPQHSKSKWLSFQQHQYFHRFLNSFAKRKLFRVERKILSPWFLRQQHRTKFKGKDTKVGCPGRFAKHTSLMMSVNFFPSTISWYTHLRQYRSSAIMSGSANLDWIEACKFVVLSIFWAFRGQQE